VDPQFNVQTKNSVNPHKNTCNALLKAFDFNISRSEEQSGQKSIVAVIGPLIRERGKFFLLFLHCKSKR